MWSQDDMLRELDDTAQYNLETIEQQAVGVDRALLRLDQQLEEGPHPPSVAIPLRSSLPVGRSRHEGGGVGRPVGRCVGFNDLFIPHVLTEHAMGVF